VTALNGKEVGFVDQGFTVIRGSVSVLMQQIAFTEAYIPPDSELLYKLNMQVRYHY
jgi:hypothetical protein